MKKALVILANYDPNPSSVANCMKPLIDEMSKTFEVDILTNRDRVDILAKEVVGKANIYRVEDFRRMNTFHLNELKKIDSSGVLKFATRFTVNGLKILYYLRYVLFASEKNTGGWELERVYNKFEELHSEQNYEVVVSASLPFQNHYIAEKIKDNYGEKIKWITFEFDPYTFNHALNVSKKRKKQMYEDEKRVFQKSDRVLLTPELYDYYREHNYFNFSSKVTSLSFANLEPIKFDKSNTTTNFMREGKINCLFTGTLYEDIRNPSFLLKLFSQVDSDIHLSLMTNLLSESLKKYTPGEKPPTVIPFQKRDTSLYNLTEANILVNIGNTVEHQVPAKIFEYMATGKPIIHFSKIKKDPAKKYLEKYPKVLFINEWESDQVDHVLEITKFCEQNKHINLSFQEVNDSLGEYAGNVVRKKFLGIINEMLGVK